jgi:carbon storage regulator CsrA
VAECRWQRAFGRRHKVYANGRVWKMLVLTRKLDERVVVLDPETNEEILVVQVLDVVGGRVKLGFECNGPKLPIHRQEVFERIFGMAKPLPR